MWLPDSPLRRMCRAENETLAHILCECEAVSALRHVHLGSFFLNPEDITSLIQGPSGTLAKKQSCPEMVSDYGVKRA
jgi:hypothetical protein